jgi:hypothetical protein
MADNDPFIASGQFSASAATAPMPAPAPTPPIPPITPTPAPAPPGGDNGAGQPAGDPPAPAPEETFLKGILGGRFQKATELEQHLSQLEEKVNAKPVDPFVNDYVKGLNKAIQDGIDPKVYEKVAILDMDKMNEREALVLRAMFKDKLSQEDAEFLIDSTYRFGEGEDETSQEVKLARINAKLHSAEAKEFLSAYKVDQLTPPKEKLIETQTKAWEPAIPQVLSEFKNLTIEGKTGKYDFVVSPESMSKAQNMLKEVLSSGIVEAMPDDQGMEFARSIVKKELLNLEMANIIDTMIDSQKALEAQQKHNPRIGGTPPPQPDPKQGIAEFLANARGIKLTST